MRLSPAVACLVAGATLLVCLAQVVLRSSGTPVVKYAVPSTVSAVTPSKAVAGTIGSSEPIAAIAPLRQDAGEAEGPFECTGGASALSFGPLELNVHAKRLWGCSGADAGVRAVFLTFGSHSMADFLLNWVAHVKRLNLRLYLVGALDAKMAALCDEQGIPAATISDEHLAVMGAAKLGSHASTTYYRYAPGTFLRMGLIKQVFIRQMLLAGLDAMVSDVDVAWFRSPWPLVRYGDASQPAVRPSARLLALADVVLSVDQVQQYMDSDKHAWHIGSELNTGVAFFRNSAGGLRHGDAPPSPYPRHAAHRSARRPTACWRVRPERSPRVA